MAVLETISGHYALSGRQIALAGTLLAVQPVPTTANGNTPPGQDGLARGIVGPATLYTQSTGGITLTLGRYALRGVVGIPTVAGAGPAFSSGAVKLTGLNSLDVQTGGIAYLSNPQASYAGMLTAYDDLGLIGTFAFTVQCGAEAVTVGSAILWDSTAPNTYGDNNGYCVIGPVSHAGGPSGVTHALADASGLFGLDPDGDLALPAASQPAASHYGAHPISLNSSSGASFATTALVLAEQSPILSSLGFASLYSNAQIGDVIAQIGSYSEVGIKGLTISSPRNNVIIGKNGAVTLIAALGLGNAETFTVRATSTSGKIKDRTYLYTVLAGTLLPASAMTAAIHPLSNFSPTASSVARPVLDPAVTGLAGPITWSLAQSNRSQAMENLGHPTNFQQASSGSVTTQVQLCAGSYTLTLRAVSGSVMCIASFAVPVSRFVGPLIFVGQGMTSTSSAAYQAAVSTYGTPAYTYEHWAQCYQQFQGYGDCPAAFGGASIYVFANSNRNYYANDNVDAGGYALRFGMAGPADIIGVPTGGVMGGTMPRWGGPEFSGAAGGVDEGDKGFIVLNSGDFRLSYLEISFVNANGYQGSGVPGSSGTGCGIRWNGETYGSLSVDNCYIHDCGQGIQTGISNGSVRITNTEVCNCGGTYTGAGANHNLYIGEVYSIYVRNLLTHRTFNGHNFKCRAQNGDIQNSRFFDGERGAASNTCDLCEGGVYTFSNNVLHKGCFSQNPNILSWCEDSETIDYDVRALTANNNIFICNAPAAAQPVAIFMQGLVSSAGLYSSATAAGNSFWGLPPASYTGTLPYVNFDYSPGGDGRAATIGNTGATTLAAQPKLDFSHPFTATGGVPARVGPFYFPYDGENRTNYVNSYGVQVDPGNDDIHVSVSAAPAGTTLFTATATGAPYFQSNPSQPDIRIDPFVSGTTWALVFNAASYVNGPYLVAPAGRYALVPSSDGTSCAVQNAQALTGLAGTTDTVCLAATAPNGTVAQNLIYMALAA